MSYTIATTASEAARERQGQQLGENPPIKDETIAVVLLVVAMIFVGYRLCFRRQS